LFDHYTTAGPHLRHRHLHHRAPPPPRPIHACTVFKSMQFFGKTIQQLVSANPVHRFCFATVQRAEPLHSLRQPISSSVTRDALAAAPGLDKYAGIGRPVGYHQLIKDSWLSTSSPASVWPLLAFRCAIRCDARQGVRHQTGVEIRRTTITGTSFITTQYVTGRPVKVLVWHELSWKHRALDPTMTPVDPRHRGDRTTCSLAAHNYVTILARASGPTACCDVLRGDTTRTTPAPDRTMNFVGRSDPQQHLRNKIRSSRVLKSYCGHRSC